MKRERSRIILLVMLLFYPLTVVVSLAFAEDNQGWLGISRDGRREETKGSIIKIIAGEDAFYVGHAGGCGSGFSYTGSNVMPVQALGEKESWIE